MCYKAWRTRVASTWKPALLPCPTSATTRTARSPPWWARPTSAASATGSTTRTTRWSPPTLPASSTASASLRPPRTTTSTASSPARSTPTATRLCDRCERQGVRAPGILPVRRDLGRGKQQYAADAVSVHRQGADEETGLYYFGARYYDPRTSVWQSADPILGKYLAGAAGGMYESSNLGLNSYGRNNPVIFKDPDGNIVPLIMGAIWLGGAAMTAYDTYQTYKHEGAKAAAVELAKGAVITAATGGAVKLAVKGFKIANDVYHVVKTTRHLQQHVNEVAKAVDETVAAGKSAKVYSINSQKQAGHVPGTPQNVNRVKQGKPTSTFFGQQSGEMATQIANERGAPIPG